MSGVETKRVLIIAMIQVVVFIICFVMQLLYLPASLSSKALYFGWKEAAVQASGLSVHGSIARKPLNHWIPQHPTSRKPTNPNPKSPFAGGLEEPLNTRKPGEQLL